GRCNTVTDEPNLLGLAIKQLLQRGVKYEREIRPRETVHGIVMKQHLQPFILITKMSEFGRSAETDFARAHRFLVETSLTHEQPIVLAYKQRNTRIKFYALDPWNIKKESSLVRIEDYVMMRFPLKLGWKWDPSRDLAVLWARMRASRYSKTKLGNFHTFSKCI
ncbi:MAG: hypothetical protein KAT53_09560, partial [Dehalococcoidia bacterium]|nr:hypothetical protein [Dehalococcoidia bacterium]